MKNKAFLLAAGCVVMAAMGLGLVVWWRYEVMASAQPPMQVAIILDASNSMQRDCTAEEAIARRVMDVPGAGRGSTFTIIRTGEDATKLEPQLVFQETVPVPLNAGPLGGRRRAESLREAFIARAKKACLDVHPTTQSPIIRAVRRGLAHLVALGCARESRCALIVHSDLQDNDTFAALRHIATPQVPLDNTGIQVVLCGYSETVRDGSAVDTETLLATWKGLFIEPVRFAPFCGATVLADIPTNTKRRLMGLTTASYATNDKPLQAFSPTDVWTLGDAFEGTVIFGSPGSGKTSGSGKNLAHALLRTPGLGALILTAKSSETNTWVEYARACGREQDLLIFNAESGHQFDPIWYEWNRPGRGAGDIESIIDLFSSLLAIGKTHTEMSSDRFWQLASEQLVRNVIVLLALSREPMSITNMNRVVQSLPSRPGEFEEEEWQKNSYCAKLIAAIEARKGSLTEDQWSDLDMATQYAFKRWPSLDERPRSSIEMTFSGLADKFLFNPLNRIFCSGKATFLPELTTHQSRIVIVDFPLLEYGFETGRLIACLMKLIWQRAWLRRNLSQSANPCMLFADEFQYFITNRDNAFQQTCRSSRIAVVYLTQSVMNLACELGETQPGAKTKAFLGNLMLKVFHCQSDPETNLYAAELIGKQYRYLDSYNSDATGGASFGAAQQLVYNVEPIAFSQLAKPDSISPISTAIVYQGGKTFNATITPDKPQGRNYLTVAFSRDI